MKKIFSLFAAVLFGVGTIVADEVKTVDFESEAESYADWTFTNFASKQTNSNVTAHGGSYFGNTGGKTTGSVATVDKVNPVSITFYYSKQSTNTTASTWYVQVSEDGKNWDNVGEGQSASAGVTRGTWYEFTRDLTAYSDVYVRVYYDGTTALRCIDDVELKVTASAEPTKVANPKFSLKSGIYEGEQSVEITCSTADAAIYYTIDGEDPTTASNVYTEAIPVAESLTIKAFAVKAGLENSEIVEAEYTIIAGADVVLDFTDNTAWGFPVKPEDNSKIQGLHEYTDGVYTVSVYGPEVDKEGFYYDGDNIMIGKEGGYLQLPAFEKPIARIVTAAVPSGSGSVDFNIFDGDDAVSTKVTSCKVDQTFDIAPQKANVKYIIKITNSNNVRFSKIKIWFGEDIPSAIDNTNDEVKTIKRIENGQLVIIKNGVRYNALGAQF